MNLHDLGWNAHFARHYDVFSLAHPSNRLEPARIVRQERGRYLVTGTGGTRPAVVRGRLRAPSDTPTQPVVGDWVLTEPAPTDDLVVIHHILPRHSAFSRKIAGPVTREQVVAANLDTLFLVSGLDHEYNPRRIERYVLQAWNSGAVPVIVLNKADGCPDAAARCAAMAALAPGVDVHALSALHNEGLEALEPYLAPGRTVALVGSSGVGKSTLANRLIGRECMHTAPVRTTDSRGRHTTSHRELLVLPGGGLLIDTPGMRELQLWVPADTPSFFDGFADIKALAEACRFRDCAHEHEPGCAVQAALAAGRLDARRFRNYVKMKKELAYLARRQQEAGTYAERQRGRQGARLMRQINKHNPKRR